MKTSEYWDDAALRREIAIQSKMTYTAEEIITLYKEALEDIKTETEKIKANFARRFGIDNETAEFFLTQAQEDANTERLLEALVQAPTDKAREDILTYIRRDGLSARAYTARRERYRAVEKEIYARIKEIAVKATPILENALKNVYKEGYYGMIDDVAKGLNAGVSFSLLNDDAITEAVSRNGAGRGFRSVYGKIRTSLPRKRRILL